MTIHPRIDDAGGLWKLSEIANFKLAGHWPDGGTRALCAGGRTPSESNVIDYVNMVSTGNFSDFGDLQSTKYNMASASNGIRGFFMGGYDGYPSESNVIDYFAIGRGKV